MFRIASIARKVDIPAVVAEALVVLIALGLAFVGVFVGWVVGYSTRTRTR